MDEELKERVRFVVMEWEESGVSFRIEELGAVNDAGKMVHEKRERVVLDGVPLFLFSPPEVAWLRAHEDEIIRYLEERDELA